MRRLPAGSGRKDIGCLHTTSLDGVNELRSVVEPFALQLKGNGDMLKENLVLVEEPKPVT